MNLAEWLYRTAHTRPEAPALFCGQRLVADYQEFARRASALGGGLARDYGVVSGDRVGVLMKNRIEYLEVLYGIWWLGAAVVPINAKLHPREAEWILDNAGCKVVYCDATTAAVLNTDATVLSVDESAHAVMREGKGPPRPLSRKENDLAWLFYTSGTTGRPKGVMLSHGNLVVQALCYVMDVEAIAPSDAILYAAPMSHGAGVYNFQNVRAGARHVVPASGGFDAAEVLDLAQTLRNVSLFAAPTMVRRLVDAAKVRGMDGDGIKSVIYGGGPMYLADIEKAIAVMGQRFIQIYAQAESPMTITALSRRWHESREYLSSVGLAESAVELRITGEDGQALEAGEVGEIEVKGPAVMLGYWNDLEATAEALRDGWLRTGDVGVLDEDGFLTLRDRSKDMIVSGGSNIYPREVEEVLLRHADVREAAVVGRPHPEWGEEVVAFVVMQKGVDIDPVALDVLCLENIARFKRPKSYLAIDELPKNNYGKVVKVALRERLQT